MFCPMMLARRVRRLAGSPRIRVRLRPARDYGRERPAITCGSNHVRYVGPDLVVRLTTDAPVTAVVEENAFFLEHAVTLLLGPDETVQGAVADVGTHFFEETAAHWREWVRSLAIPFEWQDAVIRAALTVELDVYGSAILAATHVFFDRRLVQRGDEVLFRRLEALGERAAQLFDQPDAGIWELRGAARVHTSSSVMCWAGCDRLARVASHLGLADRAAYWREHAARIHDIIQQRAWNPKRESFAATFGGEALDASLLRLNELGFLADDDPRFAATVRAIGRELKRGDFVFRYVEHDDFGKPENTFLVCTFWYINALAALA